MQVQLHSRNSIKGKRPKRCFEVYMQLCCGLLEKAATSCEHQGCMHSSKGSNAVKKGGKGALFLCLDLSLPLFQSLCLSLCVTFCLSLSLSLSLSHSLSFCLPRYLCPCLCLSLSVFLSLSLSVSIFVSFFASLTLSGSLSISLLVSRCLAFGFISCAWRAVCCISLYSSSSKQLLFSCACLFVYSWGVRTHGQSNEVFCRA